jgi:hypothetical protein
MAVSEDHANGVGALRLDVGQRPQLVGVPGVGVIDAPHDEVVAVALDQPAVADVQTGGLGAGLLGGLGRAGAQDAEQHQPDEGGQPGQKGT